MPRGVYLRTDEHMAKLRLTQLARRTHGMSGSPEWNAWKDMRRRCQNPNHRAYSYYGGRGITVCVRWASFENFLEDMGPRPAVNLSLDRIDNRGNYEPENCRWATKKEQIDNRRCSCGCEHCCG